jgi:hypothetical protein
MGYAINPSQHLVLARKPGEMPLVLNWHLLRSLLEAKNRHFIGQVHATCRTFIKFIARDNYNEGAIMQNF